MLLLLLIITLSNDFFWLLPWNPPAKPTDIGLLIIMAVLAFRVVFVTGELQRLFSNVFSWLFLALFFLFLIQVPLAAINYDQSLKDALIAVRHQFYYLSFFVFLSYLRTADDVIRFLDALSVVAFILCLLAAVDYFVVDIFRTTVENDYSVVRGGIARAQIPAMGLLSLVALWQISRWTYPLVGQSRWWTNVLISFLFLVHLFRQGRVRLFSLVLGAVWLLVLRGKVKGLAVLALLGTTIILVSAQFAQSNLFVNLLTSGVEDAVEVSGTAASRSEMLKADIQAFSEHPYVGGGTIAIRVDLEDSSADLSELARSADMGYSRWLKHFGIVGVAWLVAFCLAQWVLISRIRGVTTEPVQTLAAFSYTYLIYFLVSSATINHLLFPRVIPLMCLVCVVLVRAYECHQMELYGHSND